MIEKKALDKINQFNKEHPEQAVIMGLIKKFDIKKVTIAKLINMKHSSFTNKADAKQDRFWFTENEIHTIIDALWRFSDTLRAELPTRKRKA